MRNETLRKIIEEVLEERKRYWHKFKPKFREIKRLVRKDYSNALMYNEDTGRIEFSKNGERHSTEPIDKADTEDIAMDIRAVLQGTPEDADLSEKKRMLYELIEEVLEEEMLDENGKKDACYHKVKARYDVWPSAYASGALVKCRKVGAKNWGNKSKKKNESLDEAEITDDEKEELEDVSKQLKGAVKAHGKQAKSIDKALKKEGKKNCGCGQDPCKTYGIQEEKKNIELEERCQKGYKTHDTQKKMFGRTYRNCVKAEEGQLDEEGLRDWFDDKDGDGQKGWEQIGGKYDGKPCAKQPGQKTKPKCASPEKAASMSKKERDNAAKRKRKKDPNPNRKGKAKNVNTDPKKESLNKIIEEVIEEMNNELAEAELEEKKNSKCTKVTKKASSTRKGKKWMKCVKSDSGGYKRIHWGQAGVRVTGKSGNTKRKKSFKARHGCKGAKANTPKGQACKDWAEE